MPKTKVKKVTGHSRVLDRLTSVNDVLADVLTDIRLMRDTELDALTTTAAQAITERSEQANAISAEVLWSFVESEINHRINEFFYGYRRDFDSYYDHRDDCDDCVDDYFDGCYDGCCDKCGKKRMTPFESAIAERFPNVPERIAQSLRVPLKCVTEALSQMIAEGHVKEVTYEPLSK